VPHPKAPSRLLASLNFPAGSVIERVYLFTPQDNVATAATRLRVDPLEASVRLLLVSHLDS